MQRDRFCKIALETTPQVLGFSDVNDATPGVEKPVNAWGGGDISRGWLPVVAGRHDLAQ